MELRFVRSLAGHDKDEIYYVLKEEGDFFFLVNGKNKTLDRAKRKKKKHSQIIKNLPEEVTKLFETETFNDELIKRSIKTYLRRLECQKQM